MKKLSGLALVVLLAYVALAGNAWAMAKRPKEAPVQEKQIATEEVAVDQTSGQRPPDSRDMAVATKQIKSSGEE